MAALPHLKANQDPGLPRGRAGNQRQYPKPGSAMQLRRAPGNRPQPVKAPSTYISAGSFTTLQGLTGNTKLVFNHICFPKMGHGQYKIGLTGFSAWLRQTSAERWLLWWFHLSYYEHQGSAQLCGAVQHAWIYAIRHKIASSPLAEQTVYPSLETITLLVKHLLWLKNINAHVQG